MSKTLYLHLGMDKTGTSAIQNFCYRNKLKLLNEYGIMYPETGIWTDYSHHPFAFSVFDMGGYSIKDLSGLSKRLKQEIKRIDKVLISSECLFKATFEDHFNAFRKKILSLFNDVKVIVYVRRQDFWVESRHKHSILSGSEISLETLKKPWFCNYKQFIDKWNEEVGAENIFVRAYEKQQFINHSIFYDFFSIFGINDLSHYEFAKNNINFSLKNDENEFKKHCNLIGFNGEGVEYLNHILIQHASSSKLNAPETRLMSPLERLELLTKYAKHNNEIASQYLFRRNEPLFYDSLPNTDEPWAPYTGLTADKVLEISQLIATKSPQTLHTIKELLDKAAQSNETPLQESIRILAPLSHLERGIA